MMACGTFHIAPALAVTIAAWVGVPIIIWTIRRLWKGARA